MCYVVCWDGCIYCCMGLLFTHLDYFVDGLPPPDAMGCTLSELKLYFCLLIRMTKQGDN